MSPAKNLPPVPVEQEEVVDHPDEVTADEVIAGREVYQTVDDLDDESNGIDQ